MSDHRDPPPATASRRDFCAHVCQATSLLAVAGLVNAACGGPTSPSDSGSNAPPLATLSGTVSGRVVSLTVDGSSPLAATGSAGLLQTSLGSFLVARVSDTSFNVFTSVCTHQSCTVSGFSGGRFVCPCHGSQFTTGGAVANGPATRALQPFTAQFANGVVSFSV